jgi:hypothetical protein
MSSNVDPKAKDQRLLKPWEVDVHPAAVAPDPGYRRTLLDRLGPEAGNVFRAWSYAIKVFGGCLLIFGTASTMLPVSVYGQLAFMFGMSLACTLAMLCFVFGASNVMGALWKQLMMSGASTPYQDRFSKQDALVMRGDVAGALRSYEELILGKDAGVDVVEARMRAAELFAGAGGDPARAADLLREVQRTPGLRAGQFIHVTNRLVDLYLGPLGEPRRALVELRRLIERYPVTPAAAHARVALAKLKRELGTDQS